MVRLSAKASVTHSPDGAHSSQLALALPVGDVKVKATLKDVTLTKEPRYKKGLLLGVEKPGDFSVDYNVEDGALKFQFDTSTKVLGPLLKLSYTHGHLKHDTTLQGALLLNPDTKVTTKWDFTKEVAIVKLTHTRGSTTLEPAYDAGARTFSFAATQRIAKKSTLRASYDQKGKQTSIEWSRQGSEEGGPIKIAVTTTAGSGQQPKVVLEKAFNLF